MKRRILCIIYLVMGLLVPRIQAQYLDHVVPVSIGQNSLKISDSTSFILTAVDYNFYTGKSSPYNSAIEIVDAAKPWPPRWFTYTPFDVNEYSKTETPTTLLDASVQNGKMTFFSVISAQTGKDIPRQEQAYLFCNTAMWPADTFTTADHFIDGHDFKTSPSGEKLYFSPKREKANGNTTPDAQSISSQALYEEIQIADRKGKVVFSWDPMQKLGAGAIYLPYKNVETGEGGQSEYNWTGGGSLSWDEDGNILYSFENIGIGKISRADGHIIWRIDRSKQKINMQSDELPIYLQHSFGWVKSPDGSSYYTVLSNGDSLHPHCVAYQFTVKVQDGTPVVKVIKKIKPAEDLPNTLGGGNYDEASNGTYVFNYGAYWAKDPSVGRPVFEYGDKNGNLARYTVPYTIICDKVHTYDNPRPPRPVIKAAGNVLTASGLKNYKWYKLSGKELTTATEVGSGPTLKTGKGTYCVTAKYGIGCSVSEPVEVQ